jgi:phage terminase large subunit-like protein
LAGSGKSHILNHLPLLVIDDPRTHCIMYRKTNPQLEGGLWPNGCEIYKTKMPPTMKPKVREQKKEIIFPNGAKIKYQQAENTAKAKDDAQGQEFTMVTVDEACQHDFEFLEYLMSRLRSPSRHFSRMVMSCNPDPDHKIRELIDWYIGEDGFPIPEREGVVRYFIRESGEFVWGDTREDLGDRFGIAESDWEEKIISFSFVSGLVYDNPFMLENNKSYVAFLEGLNEVDKAQLLYGNWDARLVGANYWERGWLKEISTDEAPSDISWCRAYDLATTERSQANKYPDPTACAMIGKSNGYYYLAGNYHENFYDDLYEVYGQFCKRSGDRDNHIIMQAELDGDSVTIVLPVDPGASGRTAYESMAANFTEHGFLVKPDPMPNNKSKLVRFQPFATACENGLVSILVDTFDKKTLSFIYKQLEKFDGERSTASKKDEFPDLFSSGFNFMAKNKIAKPFTLPNISSPTKLSRYKSSGH